MMLKDDQLLAGIFFFFWGEVKEGNQQSLPFLVPSIHIYIEREREREKSLVSR